jgi:hypothetical protein
VEKTLNNFQKERLSAAIQLQYLWLATNQCVVATEKYRRDSKVMPQNRAVNQAIASGSASHRLIGFDRS